ncbi:hypothetical protein ALC60_03432 [Trachymyrmex zeteki]|uniref:Uncharacterized protein n=1 Tax=Mycetomoellerius zeteki TaxID=64791 RepID=A0A151XAQ8_9HYME|nr:hypothetical protein ALC60_03432 [Trachymyrmex zeteki]
MALNLIASSMNATAANTKKQRREKQEEDAGAKNKAHRRSRRYELHCFTVGASTRVIVKAALYLVSRPFRKRDDVRHRVPLRHTITSTDSSTFLRVSLSPFRYLPCRNLLAFNHDPTRGISSVPRARFTGGYDAASSNRARSSETYVRLNRFAGVKPAGRRRLLPVERDRKGKKEKGKRRRTVGTRGEANIALVWRGTEGTKKSKVEAGRLKTGKKDGTWLKERSRRTGRANERQRPRLDLSDCLWLAAGCTDHTPLSAHQRPISFVSAGVARVSYRCVYNLPHGFLIRLPDSANRGDKRASAAFASRVYLCKRKRYSDLRRMNHNDGTAVQ